jgi:hypothetical protein
MKSIRDTAGMACELVPGVVDDVGPSRRIRSNWPAT